PIQVVPELLVVVDHHRFRLLGRWRDDDARLLLAHEALRADTEGQVAVTGNFSKESAGHASQIKRGARVLQNREVPLLKQGAAQVILIFPRLFAWSAPGFVAAAASVDG